MLAKVSRVLVTGGAGYIGSHTARQLLDAGYELTVVDTLYSGHRWAIPEGVDFHHLDAGDAVGMTRLLERSHIEVMCARRVADLPPVEWPGVAISPLHSLQSPAD